MGDPAIHSSLHLVRTILIDGTFDRCALQDKKGYKKEKFSQVGLFWLTSTYLNTLDARADGRT
jgi:hypothetical protein